MKKIIALSIATLLVMSFAGCTDSSTSSTEKKPETTPVSIEMVLVEGGEFVRGCTFPDSSICNANEKPAHKVRVSPFYIGVHEITQAQFKTIMGNNPSYFTGCDSCPVENVTWDDAMEFIKKLNVQTGKTYRLPSESEWEFAARGGNKTSNFKFAGHPDSLGHVAWHMANSGDKTHPAKSKKPNELGIYDMNGNVWEWCNDWYHEGSYVESTIDDHNGPESGKVHAVRGGSWENSAHHCTVSARMHEPDEKGDDIGFRVAMSK